jgi:hypothetical protein
MYIVWRCVKNISDVHTSVFGSGFNQLSGSGSRRAKMTHKNRKKFTKFHVLKCRMFSFEGWRPKPWIRIRTGIQPNILDPDPKSMNLDPKHCTQGCVDDEGFQANTNEDLFTLVTIYIFPKISYIQWTVLSVFALLQALIAFATI